MRRAQATSREMGLAVLIMVVLMIYLYFSTPHISGPEVPFKESCALGGNLSCYSLFLKRGSSKLELAIMQNTGKLINITSVVCTKKSGIPAVMPLLNNTILITSGERAYVAGSNSGNEVFCTERDGRSIPTAAFGEYYEGNVYITYTESKTGETNFVNGTIITKYS